MLQAADIRKRILTLLVVLVLIVSPSGFFSVIEVYGETNGPEQAETVSVLAFTSDVHNGKKNVSARRLGTWIDKTKRKYGRLDAIGLCGDMAASGARKKYWSYTGAVMRIAEKKVNTVLYTTGNHEYSHHHSASRYRKGLNKYTKKFIEDAQGVERDHFRIYCMGSSSYAASKKMNRYSTEQISKLSSYLAGIGNEKPVIIITHYPLHFCGDRKIKNAKMLIDTLNTAAVGDPSDAEDDKKIVFLWGHNHTKSDTHYDQILEPGDTLDYSENCSKTIRFFYGAAGCMSDSEYNYGSASIKGKGLVIAIDREHRLTFTYYDEKGSDVTEDGTLTELTSSPDNSIKAFKPKQGIMLPCITSIGGNKLNISWNKVRGADGYDIYFSKCKDQMKFVQSVTGIQWTATGLEKRTPYQAVVKAFYMQNGVKMYIRTSPVMHAFTSGGTPKYTNPKCVKLKKAKISIKAGNTYKISAKVIKLKKKRKLIGRGHAPKLRYISNNTSVAEVNASGRISAKARGNCMVYVYAVNGACNAVTVTVK